MTCLNRHVLLVLLIVIVLVALLVLLVSLSSRKAVLLALLTLRILLIQLVTLVLASLTREPLCDCPTTYVTVLSPIVQTLVDDAANAVPLSSLFAFFSLLKFFSLSPSDCATTSVTVFSPIA